MNLRALLVVSFLVAGCADPASDKPAATVSEPALKPEPAQAAEAPKAAAPAVGTKIAITPSNASIGFVGSKVTGSHTGKFEKFSGEITVGDKPETSSVSVEIDMASVVTDSPKLDGHLKSDDFFAIGTHPKARFTSTAISAESNGTRTVSGQLELRGVTKAISFPATVNVGGGSASVKADFAINRQDFGVKYPGMPDDLIRDNVALTISVDAKATP